MAELAGVMVGNYFLLECLGREGMVETYRARPTTRGGYDVVLRIFRPAFPDPTSFQEHFADEVEKVWRCHHEHIQPLIEYGAGDDLLYSVTQATEAQTLEQFLERREGEPLSLPVVARIISQVGAALHYAHERHIAHGNIQPSSVLVENESSLLLTNFSMKHMRQESDAVVAQVQEGNAAYIAPEQVVGILSPACDIYAMGVLLFRLLTGRLPYDGESAGEIALKHANHPIPSARAWRPDVSEAVELVARVALAKSPAARFPTVAAFVDALLAAIKDDAPPVVVATPPVRRIPVRARRTAMTWSRVFTLISVLVMLSALAGIVFYFAVTPFHLENLPFLPLQNLGQAGGFHINSGDGTIPTTGPTPLASASTTPQHRGNSGNAPTTSGQTTPVAGVTPTPGTSPPAIANPGSTATPMPVICVTGTLSINGSSYLQPVIQQINRDYHAQCAGLQIALRADGSRALNLVQQGHIDIADADVTARTARSLTDHPLAALLYSLIASPNITLPNLTTTQIQAIYQGQITNWSQLGGPNEAITLILPPATSAISSIFHAFVLHGSPVKASAFVMKKDQPARVAQLVSQIPGALGFVPLAVATGASIPIQTLAIDGASASSQSLIAGTYTFWSIEHLYTLGSGTSQAQAYIQFATSPQEMNVFSRFGALPVGMIDPALVKSHVPGPQF